MAHVPVADRRRQFTDAAIKVISAEGVARATTRRIAEAAGAPAASLHYCFKTKEELLQAAFEAGTTDGLVTVGRAVSPGIGLRDGIARIMEAFAGWIRQSPEVQMAQYELTLWSLRSEGSRHLAQRVYRRYIDGCLQLLRECRADGDEDVDLELLAREMIAMLDGHVLQWLALDDHTFERMVDHATRLLQSRVTAASPVGS